MVDMGSTVIVLSESGEAAESLIAVIRKAVAEYDVTLELKAGGVASSITGRARWMARAVTAPEHWGDQRASRTSAHPSP